MKKFAYVTVIQEFRVDVDEEYSPEEAYDRVKEMVEDEVSPSLDPELLAELTSTEIEVQVWDKSASQQLYP